MKVSDYIAEFVLKKGIGFVSGLQGGASAHIFDSFDRRGISVQYAHHEQHAGQAAVGYSRFTGNLSLVISTTGPAGTNCMTPLLAAWQDSVPVIFISGQARTSQLSYNRLARQIGSQESNTLDFVRAISKRAILVAEASEVPYALEMAADVSLGGRPGPVWIDLPVDIQWSSVIAPPNFYYVSGDDGHRVTTHLKAASDRLADPSSIAVVVGGGLRQVQNSKVIREKLKQINLPMVATWAGLDFVGEDCAYYCGLIGPFGHPAANSLIEQAELTIVLGADLGVNHVRLPNDCDEDLQDSRQLIIGCTNIEQLSVSILNPNNIYVGDMLLLTECVLEMSDSNYHGFEGFFASITSQAKRDNRMPFLSDLEGMWPLPAPLVIAQVTAAETREKAIFIDGGGTALYAGFQASYIKSGDRVICSTAVSSMGTALDEYVGSSSKVSDYLSLVIIGDGSFQMSVASLGGVARCQGPALILVLNNAGYAAIRHTQRDFLGNRQIGVSLEETKYGSVEELTQAFCLEYRRIDSLDALDAVVTDLSSLNTGVLVCEANVCPEANTAFSPRLETDASGKLIPVKLSAMRSYWDDYDLN